MKMQSAKCPGCGVPFFVDAEKGTAVFCPYCGTKIVMNDSTVGNNRTDRNVGNNKIHGVNTEKANSDIPQS